MDKNTAISEQIWLNYFNEYLYEKGFINEQEKNKMAHEISAYCNMSILEKSGSEKVY